MTDVATNGDWVLPEQVTLATVAALFRQCAEQPAAIRAFDLSHVQDIDSAGVARTGELPSTGSVRFTRRSARRLLRARESSATCG